MYSWSQYCTLRPRKTATTFYLRGEKNRNLLMKYKLTINC